MIIQERPKSLTINRAGPIGIESADFLNAFGASARTVISTRETAL